MIQKIIFDINKIYNEEQNYANTIPEDLYKSKEMLVDMENTMNSLRKAVTFLNNSSDLTT